MVRKFQGRCSRRSWDIWGSVAGEGGGQCAPPPPVGTGLITSTEKWRKSVPYRAASFRLQNKSRQSPSPSQRLRKNPRRCRSTNRSHLLRSITKQARFPSFRRRDGEYAPADLQVQILTPANLQVSQEEMANRRSRRALARLRSVGISASVFFYSYARLLNSSLYPHMLFFISPFFLFFLLCVNFLI